MTTKEVQDGVVPGVEATTAATATANVETKKVKKNNVLAPATAAAATEAAEGEREEEERSNSQKELVVSPLLPVVDEDKKVLEVEEEKVEEENNNNEVDLLSLPNMNRHSGRNAHHHPATQMQHGAYAVPGIGSSGDIQLQYPPPLTAAPIQPLPSITTNPNESQNNDHEGLVVANPINDDPEHAITTTTNARPMYPQSKTQQEELRKRQLFFWIGLVSCVGLAIFLALFFGLQQPQQQNDNQGNNNNDNTLGAGPPTTTNASSASTGMTRNDKLKSVLPNFTLPQLQYDDTPQSKAFTWLIEDPNFDTFSNKRLRQRYALATFWYATHGQKWGPNWLNISQHECSWELFMPENDKWYEGLVVRYSDHKYIHGPCTPMNYSCAAYRGGWDCNITEHNTDDSNSFLEDEDDYLYLAMRFRELDGELPLELTMLTSLKMLQLDQTTLAGRFPSVLSELTTLENLHLYKTQLSGTIPSTLAQLTGEFCCHNI